MEVVANIMRNALKSTITALIASSVISGPACAARFPNAVEKNVELTGSATATIAELFGMPANEQSSVSLKLGRMDTWAVYLLKKDTKVKLFNDNDGAPERINTLEFVAKPAPSITIHPFWMDLGTRAPQPAPGQYSFGSPFIPDSLDGNDAWTQIVRKLVKQSDFKQEAPKQITRSYDFAGGAHLQIDVNANHDYEKNRNGHLVMITVRDK